MLHKNLKSLKRSISEKLLGVKNTQQRSETPGKIVDRPSSSSSIEDDPFKEFLNNNSDNVSHLVFHGSSVKSLSTYDLNRETRRSTTSSTSRSSSQSSSLPPPKDCKRTKTIVKPQQSVTFAS